MTEPVTGTDAPAPAPPPGRGTLYCIPTPIGEASDLDATLTPQAARIAAGLDYFVAESAKVARAFLRHLPLRQPLQSLQIIEHNQHTLGRDPAALLAPLLAGRDGGLLSDAGCPGIADPGADVVAAAHRLQLRVVPLVGPSSLLLALMASGLNGQRFAFAGYVPVDREERRARLAELEAKSRRWDESVLMIETPYRNEALLQAMLETLRPDTRVAVAVDVGQPGEWIRSATVQWWRQAAVALPKAPAVFMMLAGAERHAPAGRPDRGAARARDARPPHKPRTPGRR